MYKELKEREFVKMVKKKDVNDFFTKEGLRSIFRYLKAKDDEFPFDFQVVTAEAILKYYTEYEIEALERMYDESIDEIAEYKIVIYVDSSRVVIRERRAEYI